MLKIDKVDNHPISNNILKKIKSLISNTKANIVIFSDFRHGIFNKSTIPLLTSSIRGKVFKVADSQVSYKMGKYN